MREHLTPVALAALLVASTLGACRPPPSPPEEESTTSSGTTAATEYVGTTVSMPDVCQSSEECEEESHCVAAYDPGADPPRGPGACVEACIEMDDLTRWCFDDQGCCGELRCREVDGFCEPPPGSDESSSGSGGSSSGSGGSSSGSDTGGSSGSSTSSGGSSSSG